MIFSGYRSKAAFVVIVGFLVTVGLVTVAAFYFLDQRASEQALRTQEQSADRQGEDPSSFAAPLAGSGLFNADMIDVPITGDAQVVSADGTSNADSTYHFQSPEYLVPENQNLSDVSSGGVITDDDAVSGSPSTINPDKSTVYRLRVQGDKVYLPSGKEAILRGYSWGAWNTARFHDADRNASEGANTVRIILRWWGRYADESVDSRDDSAPGNISVEHLKELDRMVEQAAEKGLWIDLVLDSDCGQSGLQQDPPGTKEYCDPTGKYGAAGHNFWTDRDARAKFIEAWKFVADRYKDTPYIGMFELLPEPNPATFSAIEISKFYQELIDTVHPIDSRTPFLIGGRVYMIKMSDSAYIDTDVPIIYTGNLFAHPEIGVYEEVMYDLVYRLGFLTSMREKRNVPVFVQQTGVRSADDPGEIYTNAVLALLNKNNVGWHWWEYRQQGPFSGGYGVWYVRNNDVWVKKDVVSQVISTYLKE